MENEEYREIAIEEAVEWCRDNGRRGWSAIKSGLFAGIKDPRTINKRLDSVIKTGEEKQYCKILTASEETVLVRHIKNKQRCLQSMKRSEVEQAVLRLLSARVAYNKKGGRKHIALSQYAKDALESQKVSRSFFRRLRVTYPELKLKKPKKN